MLFCLFIRHLFICTKFLCTTLIILNAIGARLFYFLWFLWLSSHVFFSPIFLLSLTKCVRQHLFFFFFVSCTLVFRYLCYIREDIFIDFFSISISLPYPQWETTCIVQMYAHYASRIYIDGYRVHYFFSKWILAYVSLVHKSLKAFSIQYKYSRTFYGSECIRRSCILCFKISNKF